MEKLNERLYNWASDIDAVTLEQAERTARLPIVDGHVALMPDAHLGKGCTIGSVVPTRGAVIPSAVGVDQGCGMAAVRTSVTADGLPDDLDGLIPHIEQAVPAGLGRWHENTSSNAAKWLKKHPNLHLTESEENKALKQFGSLGSGNHFFELSLDETERLWVVLHSGSRGPGNTLASRHIKVAMALAQAQDIPLEDKELAYLQEGTPQFDEYIEDMLWAQDYAAANRAEMMRNALPVIFDYIGGGVEMLTINCHHNFAALESHGVGQIWVTRKGAIKAEKGLYGVIPGSMGGKSYIVKGKGNPDSYNSCSHGAGRKMSRKEAKRRFSTEDLSTQMKGVSWQEDAAERLIDEIPASYKNIDVVMRDQEDLVEVVHELHGIANYKGTS